MKTLPSLRHLQYLAALAETGSFSRAAVACNVTQSTLSAGIATLEELLGQPVVDRGQKRARLTPLGEDTLSRTRAILAQAEAIMDRARQGGAPLSGPLRLGIIPTIAPYLLPRLLPVLEDAFPALQLEIHEDLTDRLLARLAEGRMDLVLMAFPYKARSITKDMLFTEPLLLASPRGRWPTPPPVTPEQLKSHDMLLLEDGHCLRDQAVAACRLRPTGERKSFSATSLPTLIQMVGHGYGMTILPRMAAETLAGQAAIDLFPFRKPVPQREIGLAWRTGHPRADEFKLLARTIRKHAPS